DRGQPHRCGRFGDQHPGETDPRRRTGPRGGDGEDRSAADRLLLGDREDARRALRRVAVDQLGRRPADPRRRQAPSGGPAHSSRGRAARLVRRAVRVRAELGLITEHHTTGAIMTNTTDALPLTAEPEPFAPAPTPPVGSAWSLGEFKEILPPP